MIATVTLNPALDETVYLERLLVGDANRVIRTETDAGGKGINASRMLRNLGAETIALGLIGGSTGGFIEFALHQEGVETDFIRVANETRTNIQIQTSDGAPPTALNQRGAPVEREELERLVDRVAAVAEISDFVIFGGSVPPNVPVDIYERLINRVEEKGAHAALDAEGHFLLEGIQATPYMIKPNQAETERILRRNLPEDEDVIKAAKELHARGIELVVISLGKRGAIAATSEGVWDAVPPPVDVISTVGSGDSMVAGITLALAQGQSFEDALRLGSACGAATAMTAGVHMGKLHVVEEIARRVKVTHIE